MFCHKNFFQWGVYITYEEQPPPQAFGLTSAKRVHYFLVERLWVQGSMRNIQWGGVGVKNTLKNGKSWFVEGPIKSNSLCSEGMEYMYGGNHPRPRIEYIFKTIFT